MTTSAVFVLLCIASAGSFAAGWLAFGAFWPAIRDTLTDILEHVE